MPADESDTDDIKIGVILAQSAGGEDKGLNAVRLALEQSARTGLEGRNFRLCTYYVGPELAQAEDEDEICDIYSQLISVAKAENVLLLIAPSMPEAAAAAVQDSCMPIITTESLNEDMIFSLLSPQKQLGEDIADFVFDMLGMPDTAILYDEEHSELANAFYKHLSEQRGIENAYIGNAFADENADESVAAAIEIKPKVLFIACGEEYTVKLCKIVRDMEFSGKIVVMNCSDNAALLEMNNIICVTNFSIGDKASVSQSFISAFQDHFGELPNEQAALMYDCARIATEAIAKAIENAPIDGSDEARAAVSDAIFGMSLGGVTGKLEFSDKPYPERERIYLSINNGTAEFYTRY